MGNPLEGHVITFSTGSAQTTHGGNGGSTNSANSADGSNGDSCDLSRAKVLVVEDNYDGGVVFRTDGVEVGATTGKS